MVLPIKQYPKQISNMMPREMKPREKFFQPMAVMGKRKSSRMIIHTMRWDSRPRKMSRWILQTTRHQTAPTRKKKSLMIPLETACPLQMRMVLSQKPPMTRKLGRKKRP